MFPLRLLIYIVYNFTGSVGTTSGKRIILIFEKDYCCPDAKFWRMMGARCLKFWGMQSDFNHFIDMNVKSGFYVCAIRYFPGRVTRITSLVHNILRCNFTQHNIFSFPFIVYRLQTILVYFYFKGFQIRSHRSCHRQHFTWILQQCLFGLGDL